MDIEMPAMDGIEATRTAKERYPNLHIIMLTVFDREDRIFEAILAGATGYLLKDERPVKIIGAIKESIEFTGKRDMQTKVMVAMIGLFAEIERDLISQRTKEGLVAARAKGKILGRPNANVFNALVSALCIRCR